MAHRQAWLLALVALVALAATGCPSQALLQSAATVPVGKVQHQLGVEWFSVRYREASPTFPGGPPSTPSTRTYQLPIALPFYGGRVGLAERFDIGFRVSAALTLGFDLKLQIIDTEAVDVAIAPSFQFGWFWSWMQLPLLVGLNLSDAVQVQLTGRMGYLVPLQDDLMDVLDGALGDRGVFAGGGVGLYFRLGEHVALVPEVQVLRGNSSTDPTLISVCVGITFGAQPGVQPAPPQPMPPPPGAYPAAPGAPVYPGYPASSTPQPLPPPPPGYGPTVPPGYGQPPPAPDALPPSPWPVAPAPEPTPPVPAPAPPS